MIKSELMKQIQSNEDRKKKEKEDDIIYGQKMSIMAQTMQKKEHERQKKQREMHFKMMTQHWDEQKREKQELADIAKIFK